MKLDFSELKENVLIEEGEHELTIVAAKEAKSQNGTPMLVVDFHEVETEGFTRDNICLAGPGAFKAKQFMKALGLEEEEFASMDAADLVGLNINADITNEEYEGEVRAKVKKYIA